MQARFKQDYSELSKENFDIVYAEFQDVSGLFLTEDFERVTFINHLRCRINFVQLFLKAQREFLDEFGVPFSRDFESFKQRYGYNLKWKGDRKDFLRQLRKAKLGEVKNETTLNTKIKELKDKKPKEDDNLSEEEREKKSRLSFIRMLNSLGKMGYKIEKRETSVEELALMIKQETETQEQQTYSMSQYGR